MFYNKKNVPSPWHYPNHWKLDFSTGKKNISLFAEMNQNAYVCWANLKHFLLVQFQTSQGQPKLQRALQEL